MSQDLKDLTLACRSEKNSSDHALLEMGETVSFFGSPARAEKDTIALRTGDYTLVIKEKDVLETSKYGDNYLVKVRKGTDLLFRLEVVSQAIPDQCSCNEKTGENTPMARQTQTGVDERFGGWKDWGAWDDSYYCWHVIKWVKICKAHRDKNGILHVYCYVVPVIETQCDNWPRHYF